MWPNFINTLTWWQWAALAAVPPAIVLLYFLKLKRRPLEVPSTYLWHKSIEDLHVNTIWQRLRRNILLLLQLLLLLLVIIAVVRPSWRGLKLSGNRFILLVDNSASMQATDVAPTRLDEAKRRAAEVIDEMKSGDAAMLISFTDTARVEQTFTDDRRQLHRALEAIRPTARGTSLLEALKVASGLANPGRSAEDFTDVRVAEALPAKLVIFSDGRFGAAAGFSLGNLEPVFVPVGDPEAANVGIVAFSAGRKESKPDMLQAFGRLENFGPQSAEVSLELSLDGRMIDADHVTIAAGETRGVAFDLGDNQTGTLRLHIATKDNLAVDDDAWLVLGPPRRANVLLVTPGNESLEIALKTLAVQKLADVAVESPEFLKTKKYEALAAGAAYNLVMYDRCQPKTMPQANTFFIGSVPTERGWAAGPAAANPAILDVEGAHPLLQWVNTGDVVLAEATPLVVPSGGSVLITADAGPVLAIAPREAFEDAVMGFVLVGEMPASDGKSRRFIGTNWPIRSSFPAFVLNVVSYLGGARDSVGSAMARAGKSISLDWPASQAELYIKTPDERSILVKRERSGKLNFTETAQLGVYEVTDGKKTVSRFSVNLLDPSESNIRPPVDPAIKIGHVDVAGHSGWEAGRREIWRELVFAGLFVLLVEWYIYNRRIYI